MRRTREHCKRIGLIVSAVSLVAPTAWAQAPTAPPATAPTHAAAPSAKGKPVTSPSTKKLLASADTKRSAGDFQGALADYQAADALASTPASTEGIAFCNDKLGHFDEALTFYSGFLANVPPAMQAQGDAARARVEAIKVLPGHLHLESNPSNAAVTIDGKEQPTHTPLEVDLTPGKHSLHVTAPDHDATDRDIEIASRGRLDVAIELPLTPAPSFTPPPVTVVTPQPQTPARSKLPAYITGGLAIVAAGIGTGFGIAALSDKSNYNKNPTTATANTGEDHALVADMSFGIALTLGVTSVVLFTTRNESSPAAAPATPSSPAGTTPPVKTSADSAMTFTATPFVSPHGGGAGALLRF